MPANTYKDKILAHLKTGATISPLEALNLWGCFSLSQRITELRQAGYPILSKMVTTSTGKRHAVYWMLKQGAKHEPKNI